MKAKGSAKSRQVLEVLSDGEWHPKHDWAILPNIGWKTINEMVAAGLIEHRGTWPAREFRIITETDFDFGDLWIE